jgi:hypothetical protein
MATYMIDSASRSDFGHISHSGIWQAVADVYVQQLCLPLIRLWFEKMEWLACGHLSLLIDKVRVLEEGDTNRSSRN